MDEKIMLNAGLLKVDGEWLGTAQQWQLAEKLQAELDETIECEVDDIIINNQTYEFAN